MWRKALRFGKVLGKSALVSNLLGGGTHLVPPANTALGRLRLQSGSESRPGRLRRSGRARAIHVRPVLCFSTLVRQSCALPLTFVSMSASRRAPSSPSRRFVAFLAGAQRWVGSPYGVAPFSRCFGGSCHRLGEGGIAVGIRDSKAGRLVGRLARRPQLGPLEVRGSTAPPSAADVNG